MKTVADVLGVSRSNLAERLKGKSKPRGSYLKADDAELLPAIRRKFLTLDFLAIIAGNMTPFLLIIFLSILRSE